MRFLTTLLLAAAIAAPAVAQPRPATAEASVGADAEFTIGPEDVLGVLVWREADVSGDVTVRADGMVTLPLVRDVKAAGLTTNQLAEQIQTSLREFITDASVTVVVRQMNSRKVFITGEVGKPGAYPLASTMTVMQLIAIAGGLSEFAESNSISILRVRTARRRRCRLRTRMSPKARRSSRTSCCGPATPSWCPRSRAEK